MFEVDYLKKFMTNFRFDGTLPYKYGNFTRSEFYAIFVFLVLATATAGLCTEFHPNLFVFIELK